MRTGTDRPHAWCRPCHKVYNVEVYKNNREAVKARAARHRAALVEEYRALKESTPCADCGQLFPYYVSHYDHLGYDEKVNDVSVLVTRGSASRLWAEIAKCELVCANCHALRTHNRHQYGKRAAPRGTLF